MASVTLGPDAATAGGAFALWDALYVLKTAESYDVSSDTAASANNGDFGLQIDFTGTDLTKGGTITSFSVSYLGTEEFTATGLSISGSTMDAAVGNAALLKSLFDGISWNVDFSDSSAGVHFNGTGGDDTAVLTSSADVYGLDGGNDLVNLGDGDDTVYYYSVLGYSAAGTVKLDGGDGVDTIDLSGAAGIYPGEEVTPLLHGMTINLNTKTLDFGDFTLKYSNIESILGTPFADTIIGTAGADTLIGSGAQTGVDKFTGGGGLDDLWGNAGTKDQFIYTKASDSKAGKNHDYILAFDHGMDKIDLSKLHPDTGNDHFTFVGEKSLKHAGDLRVEFHEGHSIFPAYTMVEADLDGKGGPDIQIQVASDVELTMADFIL
jgi:hypothetical protein